MSSVYRIICLSHDPAFTVGEEDWHSPGPAIAAIADQSRSHPGCDLVVGRYSYPLVEVCCPASRSNTTHHASYHRDDQWIDASWLRLGLFAGVESVEKARLRFCWTPELIRRLRFELGGVDV